MMKSLTVETKDRSWQPAQIDADATQINKVNKVGKTMNVWSLFLIMIIESA